MTDTDILTYGQGILIIIQIAVFLILYLIYEYLFSKGEFSATKFIIVTIFFSVWLFSITLFENITLALSVPVSKTANIPYMKKNELILQSK